MTSNPCRALLLFGFTLTLFAGCGGKDEAPPPPPPADATKADTNGQSFGGLSNPYNPPEKTGKKKAR